MHSVFKKFFLFIVLFSSLSMLSIESQAQCAMCSLNAENSTIEGNTQGKGLNDGILFLLAMPFIIGAGVGLVWYKYYRKPSKPTNPLL
ncbi:hypothetical protein [Sphingobacterium hungaricum]|uniref:Secreted protein n=1 Tax=Sphingobacterium hungaricum TaxID=2082723 RepID=A0A928YRZ2_9SPHI|nr:hypothetical protein [Sphingobacterium hungaricum]MBE8714690.1 hypothetical protein [Sphingobacterium hungaricum]